MPLPLNNFEQTLVPILEASEDGIALLDFATKRVLYANPTLEKWLGKGTKERPLIEFLERLSASEAVCEASLAALTSPWRMECRIEAEAGEIVELTANFINVELSDGPAVGLILRSKISDSAVSSTSRRDPLTGLVDRAFLLDRLGKLLTGERSVDSQFAVLFIDLDNFKQVNDEHGHLIGDHVLREAAQRISTCVRDCDYVSRYGGDEFVILLEQVSGRDQIEPVIQRINESLAKPITVSDLEMLLSVSIGVAEAGADHNTPEDVLNDADRAMYLAKRGH